MFSLRFFMTILEPTQKIIPNLPKGILSVQKVEMLFLVLFVSSIFVSRIIKTLKMSSEFSLLRIIIWPFLDIGMWKYQEKIWCPKRDLSLCHCLWTLSPGHWDSANFKPWTEHPVKIKIITLMNWSVKCATC